MSRRKKQLKVETKKKWIFLSFHFICLFLFLRLIKRATTLNETIPINKDVVGANKLLMECSEYLNEIKDFFFEDFIGIIRVSVSSVCRFAKIANFRCWFLNIASSFIKKNIFLHQPTRKNWHLNCIIF